MVVIQRVCILGSLLVGLSCVRAEQSARAPQWPVKAQQTEVQVPQIKSGKVEFSLTAQSPVLDFQQLTLPYAHHTFQSTGNDSVLIESDATDAVVPPAVFLYDAQGALLTSLPYKAFESENAQFLKPDRLSASLSLAAYPNQTLTLLLIPAPEELEKVSEFEHPANLMADAQSNARVINKKRQVPHATYGKITVKFKTKKSKQIGIQIDPAPSNESMPTGAINQSADTQAQPEVLDETKSLYQTRIQQALDANDINKADQLKREAILLGIPEQEFMKN